MPTLEQAERVGKRFQCGYLAVSVLWIFGTDAIFDHFSPLPVWVGSVKDVLYLAACSCVLRQCVRHYLAHVERAHADQISAKLDLVGRLAMAAEYRDDETGGHNHRIARTSQILAIQLGLPAHTCDRLFYAAALHDLGKIAIPDALLHKAGPLSPEERTVMQRHAQLGAELLGNSQNPLMRMSNAVASCHHERWDGTGYPSGLRGEEIPLEARIVAVCDVFDALTSERPYKAAWPVSDAVQEIRRSSGSHFDPQIVDAFFECLPAIAAVREESPRPWDGLYANDREAA